MNRKSKKKVAKRTCITHHESTNYMAFLNRKGFYITSHNNINTYIASTKRDTKRTSPISTKITDLLLKNFSEYSQNPIFCILSLNINDKGNKHSVTLSLDNDPYNQNNLLLELFDSNGGSDFQELVKKGKTYTLSLCNEIKTQISEKTMKTVEFSEVMYSLPTINTVKPGNCDALSYYYITIRNNNTQEYVRKYFENSFVDLNLFNTKHIDAINKSIKSKESISTNLPSLPPTKKTKIKRSIRNQSDNNPQ